MKSNKLDCCIVRDLLPLYIDKMTHPETAQQIKQHLEVCPDCRALEQDMRIHISIQRTPKKSLRIVKKVRHMQIFAAACAMIITFICIGFAYCTAFCYPNTKSGRLKAVQNYVTNGEISTEGDYYFIAKDTPIQITAYQEIDKHLFISFAAEDNYTTYGIMQLRRGINGNYRPVSAEYCIPSNTAFFTKSVYTEWFNTSLLSELILAGYQCGEAATVQVQYDYNGFSYKKDYPVTTDQFLWVWKPDELAENLKIPNFSHSKSTLCISNVTLLDQSGTDITAKYQTDKEIEWFTPNNPNDINIVFIYLFLITGLATGIAVTVYILKQE